MNFSVPSDEQVTMGLAGSSTMASTLLGFDVHLSASNAAWSCGVTHAGSLAFAGWPAVMGVAAGAGFVAAASAGGKPDLGAVVAWPVVLGLLVAVPVGVGTGIGAAEPVTRTTRNLIT